jgi:hypothetical protein
MNVYNISCRSSCGTYFASYLQSVTIIAETKGQAVELAQEWMKERGEWFIDKNPANWDVEQMREGLQQGVIAWHEDSDY